MIAECRVPMQNRGGNSTRYWHGAAATFLGQETKTVPIGKQSVTPGSLP
jgi:hypothetical protein